MQHRKDCDFSFAGLKNAFRMAVEKLKTLRDLGPDEDLSTQDKADLAASFQHAAIKHLEQRMKRAIVNVKADPVGGNIESLVVVGGVAANKAVRSALKIICDSNDWDFYTPPLRLCTDNGVMAAWAGVEKLKCRTSDAAETQEVFARYPFAST